jgi:hypothetical protein
LQRLTAIRDEEEKARLAMFFMPLTFYHFVDDRLTRAASLLREAATGHTLKEIRDDRMRELIEEIRSEIRLAVRRLK